MLSLRITFLFAAMVFFANAQPLKITQLNDEVYVVTTWHELETGPFPSNSLYVITEDGAVLIDTPWDTTQVLPLIDSIALRHKKEIVLCISTHFHDDRTGGIPQFNELGIPTYTTTMTRSLCEKNGNGIPSHTFLNDTLFTIADVTFETFYPGPGHAPDNIVIFIPRYDLLYGGCFIKSVESATLGNMADADVKSWLEGIKKVRKRYGKPSYIITGHQDFLSEKSLKHTQELLEKSR